MDYGNTKIHSMHRKLCSATLSQLAFPWEGNPNFPWEKFHWDTIVIKTKSEKVKYSWAEPMCLGACLYYIKVCFFFFLLPFFFLSFFCCSCLLLLVVFFFFFFFLGGLFVCFVLSEAVPLFADKLRMRVIFYWHICAHRQSALNSPPKFQTCGATDVEVCC